MRRLALRRGAVRSSSMVPAAVAVAVLMLYVLFGTGGLLNSVPPTSDVYQQLAESFLHGRLDLLLDPPPELAALANPYDPAERKGLDVSMDASYYRGRYYVYWGPAPGLAALVWGAVSGQPLGDASITILAAAAAFLFACLLLLRLRRLYFPSLPTWPIAVSIAAVGLAHPILWMLDYPAIYEAAVASGQAFLMAGAYFAIPALAAWPTGRASLLLAGGLWALAIASRPTLIPAVGVLALAATVGVWKEIPSDRASRVTRLGALFLPLAFGGMLLGLYNYGRFGSVAETGFRFQLMPDVDYPQLIATGEMFNAKYVAVNAAYYSVAPVAIGGGFPHITPIGAVRPGEGSFFTEGVPPGHLVEDATGILVAAPFVLFAAVTVAAALGRSLGRASRGETARPQPLSDMPDGALRVSLAFVAAGILTAIPLLTYRYVANRFELDVVPLLLLAASLGAWHIYRASRPWKVRGALAAYVIALTAVWTAVFGVLLGASRP